MLPVAALAVLSIILSSLFHGSEQRRRRARIHPRLRLAVWRAKLTTWRSICIPLPTNCSGNASAPATTTCSLPTTHSKPFIQEITRKLADYGTASGLSDAEIPYFIVSFVQNLPYTSDDLTTGFDEYPRFPYETLYDNGGDCEDTSILASAMLHELRYDVALLLFPGHMAVGFECRAETGQPRYRHHGRRYCYLETTGDDWDVGMVPPSVQGAVAIIKPIIERPVLLVEFIARYRQITVDTTAVGVTVLVTNLGSHTARGATVYVALRQPGTDLAWDQIQSERFGLVPEESFTYEVAGLRVKQGNPFQVYVQARGSNFAAQEAISEVLR